MRFLLVASLLVAPAYAHADAAQPPVAAKPKLERTPDAAKMKTDDCARARAQKKTCVIDMKGEDVEGGKPTASGITVGILTIGKADSLIRLRKDFITEILKTAEDL